MDILHLPIKHETLIKKYYDKVQDKIEEIFSSTGQNQENEQCDYNLYKISQKINLEEKINVNNNYSYIQGKNKIDDTIINISYNETKFDCNPNTIDINKIKISKTDIACWWCCHTFDNYPVSIPIKFYPENYLFKCKGIFCSFPCAYSYLCKNKMSDLTLLKMLYKKITTNCENIKINKAPKKEILKMFGGPIDINEFRNNSNNILYNINTYPIIYMNEQLHIQSIYGNGSTNVNGHGNRIYNKLNSNTIELAKQRLDTTNKTIVTGKTIADKLNKL
jgi:hypothetical protein